MENSFDNQTSSLLETVTRNRNTAPLRNSTIVDPSTSIVIDPIVNRINAIEERLNASDSIFRLAAQSNALRDKERRDQIKNVSLYAQTLGQRLDKIEESLGSIENIIDRSVAAEVARVDQSQRLKELIDESRAKFNERFIQLENAITENNKRNAKAIKKLNSQLQLIQSTPPDDSQIDEIREKLNEMKRHQNNLMSLLKSMNSQNAQDYGSVTTELDGLWKQISTKRGDTV